MLILGQPDLLKRQKVSVRTEGEQVILAVGNSELRMDYELALQLSTWMRVHGKAAKRAAGDGSRHWAVIGNLAAVEAGERPF